MKRFFTAKSIWQHTKLIFHSALNMNSFSPSALTSLVVESSALLGAFRHCDFLRGKLRVWMDFFTANDLFLQSPVLLHSHPWCHHRAFPRGPRWDVTASVLNVHQNEIWSESVELHSKGILSTVFAPSLYLSGPIVWVYSTFGYLRSPARAASLQFCKTSVVSHLHHLCDTP